MRAKGEGEVLKRCVEEHTSLPGLPGRLRTAGSGEHLSGRASGLAGTSVSDELLISVSDELLRLSESLRVKNAALPGVRSSRRVDALMDRVTTLPPSRSAPRRAWRRAAIPAGVCLSMSTNLAASLRA